MLDMLKPGDIVAVMGFSFPLSGEIIRVNPFSVCLKISIRGRDFLINKSLDGIVKMVVLCA